MSSLKLAFFSLSDPNGLCASYRRSADELKMPYQFFDYEFAVKKYVPFGKIGLKLHYHLFIESIQHKLNREFVVQMKSYKPDFIFFFTNAPVSAGALIFLKSILPGCIMILVWPDSLLNITQSTYKNLALFDAVATYSATSVNVLQSCTKAKILFSPLAGDLHLHRMEPIKTTKVDIGFVGGWRPERQRAMEVLYEAMPNHRMEILGQGWKEHCQKSNLKTKVRGTGLHGKAMAKFFNDTRVNVNIIDDTNYPAANMRFFEVLTAGGSELVSACPEMESIFQEGKHLWYYRNEAELVEKATYMLSNPEEVFTVKQQGHYKILQEHNYTERLKTIMESLI